MINPRTTILLTGSTGFIGEYLLGYLLHRRQPLALLIRAESPDAAQQRIEPILRRWEQSLGVALPRPHCLPGDLHQEGLGLSAESRKWIAEQVGTIVHNAGNVDFHQRAGDSPYETNVEGARRLIDLAHGAQIENVHYVSTAYVCGTRRGVILESELDLGQDFLSEYERSKHDAELLLRGAGFPRLTVYRPAAVVGDSKTGYTRSFHGIYWMARFTQLARERAGAVGDQPWRHPVRLALQGDERHHFVPVDWVAESIARIACDPQLHGATYHLTLTMPVTARLCEAALQRYFRYEGVRLVGGQRPRPEAMNEVEDLFYAAIEPRYWRGDPHFDCRNTLAALPQLPCPSVDLPLLVRLFDFAVACGFGRRLRDAQVAYSLPECAYA